MRDSVYVVGRHYPQYPALELQVLRPSAARWGVMSTHKFAEGDEKSEGAARDAAARAETAWRDCGSFNDSEFRIVDSRKAKHLSEVAPC